MSIGMIGIKRGMTRVFRDTGESVAVTVIEAPANRVAAIKTLATDSYEAVQVVVPTKTASKKRSKAFEGHLKKNEVQFDASSGLQMSEFRCSEAQRAKVAEASGAEGAPQVLDASQFTPQQKVDVTGTSKGKGYAGTVKRWNFRTQDATHGNSLSHRAPGSIGQCQTPGRVWKGKKMAGHMGARTVTVQGLVIERADSDRGLLLIRGAIPGANGTAVRIVPTTKGS